MIRSFEVAAWEAFRIESPQAMKPKTTLRSRFLKSSIFPTALFVAVSPLETNAAEIILDGAAGDVTVGPADTVWFDFTNTDAPIPLGTINGSAPDTGVLPGWAHTQASFLKYDGENVVELPSAEKVEGVANLASARPASVFYTTLANAPFATVTADQTIGLLETSRDFLINTVAPDPAPTLDLALGGMLFHGNSHWVKSNNNGFLTSSSGQLVVAVHGTATDYQINRVTLRDFDGETPLTLVKTGPGAVALSAVANTYSGGTVVNNGRLQANHLSAFAAGEVLVDGDTAQIYLNVGSGSFANTFEIRGDGPTEGSVRHGSLRFANNANVGGQVWLEEFPARISVNNNATGTISGLLVGDEMLEINSTAAGAFNGTLNLAGDATNYTGTILVSKGGLSVNGTLGAGGAGSVLVTDDAAIGGEGTISGDLDIGGVVSSRLIFDGSTEGALHMDGNVDVSAGTIILSSTGAPPVAGESVTVFTYGGTLTGDLSNLLNVGLRDAVITHDVANKRLLASFTYGSIGDLIWTGETSAVWAVNGENNFTSEGTATNFVNGDNVIFDDSATVKTLEFGGLVLPASVRLDHDEDYQITGTGGIMGPASLTKSGPGRLILGGTTSEFSGPISVERGTLQLANAAALGTSSGITLQDGSQLDFAGLSPFTVSERRYSFTIAGDGPDGNGVITNSGVGLTGVIAGINTITLTGDATVGGNGRFDLGLRGGNSILNGNGHTLTKVGPNEMAFRARANGSVTHFVVAEGTVIPEDTNESLGGATGSVTVKSGARLASYGGRTFATPVSLESGAMLFNLGGGDATWTGAVTVRGNVTIGSGTSANTVNLSGSVQGSGSITKAGVQNVTITSPGHSGDTTVAAGTLILGADTLGDESTVTLAAGTLLQLDHAGTDDIGALFLDGEAQAEGTYGPLSSGADNEDDTYFRGTGVLNVTGIVGGNEYETWAASNGIAGSSPGGDSDGDGVLNGIEFVIGGIPNGSNSLGLLPVSSVNGDYLDFVFRRSAESASYSPHAEYGSDLSGWTPAQAGIDSVIVTEDADHFEDGIDRVTVRIPRALATDGTIFVRLTVGID